MIEKIQQFVGSVARKCLVALNLIQEPEFIGRYSEERPSPDKLRAGELVIVGSPGFKKWACFPCPDGCGEMVSLNLSKSRRPSWVVRRDWLSRITVHPSIHEKNGCLSHYWIKEGNVVWCRDTGKMPELNL